MAELEPITTDLPPHIIFTNILPKLPAKSISRFKCISKQWHSFLTTPGFLQMHHLHVIKVDCQNYQKVFFLPNARPWVFRTIDCETPKNGFTTSRPLPFKVGPSQGIDIVTSLHGMVCLLLTKPGTLCEYSDIILWNPVTDDHKTLSKAGSDNNCYRLVYGDQFKFYYSFSEKDYKLVCLTCHRNVYIYSLKSDSWRKVDSTGMCSNTVLYSLMSIGFLSDKFQSLRKLFEFERDFTDEKLSDIETSPFARQKTDFMGFMDVKGCFHFFVVIINSVGQYDQIELWRMDECGRWEVVTSSPEEQILSYTNESCVNHRLHLMRNGNWLMHDSEQVYVLDSKNHTKDIMCHISIAFNPGGKYMETFVSPNQYMK